MFSNYLEVGRKTFSTVAGQFGNDFEVVELGLQDGQLFLPGRCQLLIDFEKVREQFAQLLAFHCLDQRSGHEALQSVFAPVTNNENKINKSSRKKKGNRHQIPALALALNESWST